MNIAYQRLLTHRIAGQKFETPAEVVRWMGAMQAQDYLQALWAVGLRTQAATAADVEQALAEGQIIRTWPMRGTIHFVAPEDAKWLLKLLASRILARAGRRLAQLDLDVAMMGRCQTLFYEALHGHHRLTRAEMLQLLEEAGISAQGQRGYHILWYAAQSGLICMGPMQDKQQTFVLLEEWAPQARELSPEEALAELTRRYLTSHGPATVYDLAWWAGLTVTEARAGVEAIRSELVSARINGQDYWLAGDAPEPGTGETAGVYLLPGFDEYLLGYKDRSAVLAEVHATKVVPGKNGVFFPVIVVAGEVAGTWKRRLKKKSVDITFSPFTSLAEVAGPVVDAAQGYSDFLGLPLSSRSFLLAQADRRGHLG